MTPSPNQSAWLSRFAWLTAAATLGLICLGGLVTSHEAGLAVPDWPNTFGYNMFFFPVSKWIGGVFFEHTHRLAVTVVGLLTTILAVWLWRRDERRWMKWLGVSAFLLVVLQAVLGGLRVILLSDKLGFFHGVIAQSFFVLVSAIALFCSPWWNRLDRVAAPAGFAARPAFLLVTTLVFVQLLLGATMRHQHAGLSIPDFPTAYGKLWPDTSDQAVERYNQIRPDLLGYKPITAFQVILQMVHRLVAAAILGSVLWLCLRARKALGGAHVLSRLALLWLGLVSLQAALGAATIWTGKSADIATAHVVVGALCLMTGALGAIISFALAAPVAYKAAFGRASMAPLIEHGAVAPRQTIS
jgi:cytochrome c oxidase assembly protein subunit 15